MLIFASFLYFRLFFKIYCGKGMDGPIIFICKASERGEFRHTPWVPFGGRANRATAPPGGGESFSIKICVIIKYGWS